MCLTLLSLFMWPEYSSSLRPDGNCSSVWFSNQQTVSDFLTGNTSDSRPGQLPGAPFLQLWQQLYWAAWPLLEISQKVAIPLTVSPVRAAPVFLPDWSWCGATGLVWQPGGMEETSRVSVFQRLVERPLVWVSLPLHLSHLLLFSTHRVPLPLQLWAPKTTCNSELVRLQPVWRTRSLWTNFLESLISFCFKLLLYSPFILASNCLWSGQTSARSLKGLKENMRPIFWRK